MKGDELIMLHYFLSINTDITQYSFSNIFGVVAALIALILSIDKILAWTKDKENNHFNSRKKNEELQQLILKNEQKIAEMEGKINAIAIGVQNVLKGQLKEYHQEFMTRSPKPHITEGEKALWIHMYDAYKGLLGNSIIDEYNKDVRELTVVYSDDDDLEINDTNNISLTK